VRPPVDNRLHGTSSWVNLATGRDRQTPDGWHPVHVDAPATSPATSAPTPDV
jgi:hypothetical protein